MKRADQSTFEGGPLSARCALRSGKSGGRARIRCLKRNKAEMTLGSAGLAARATNLPWRWAYLYRLAMSEFLRDLRFGVRLLAKSPVFAITAALLLAIGISANTLIFSLINALLLRPLPVLHPENLDSRG